MDILANKYISGSAYETYRQPLATMILGRNKITTR